MGVGRLFNDAACSSRLSRFFSTSAAMIRRPWIYDLGELEESIGESAVYRRALKFQRPTTVKFQENMLNSVSLIGLISAPFKNFDTASGRTGVYTSLTVDSPARAYSNFKVTLNFWDELAEIAVEHLKLRDLIYVSGSLVSYKNMDESGKSIYRLKVRVAEVNYIIQHSSCQNSLKLGPKGLLNASQLWSLQERSIDTSPTIEDMLRMRKARLHLWQVFFSSRDEWWDNRNDKRNPKCPDFKHKDTGEALWLKDTDPPWVKKQLLLQDSRLNKRGSKKHINASSHLSPLVFHDTPRN